MRRPARATVEHLSHGLILILGIDGHHGTGTIKTPVEFAPFKKYNQRTYKQTDSKYMDWLKEARAPYKIHRQLRKQEDQVVVSSYDSETINRITGHIAAQRKRLGQNMLPIEVTIFGHSLGITDKEILKSFITLPNTRTAVYYHSEESFSQQVSNMTGILGMDEVIARTGGCDKTLEFRDQRNPSSWYIHD